MTRIESANPIPVGTMMLWSKPGDIPEGWLLCDGRKVLRKEYPALWWALDYRPRWRRWLPRFDRSVTLPDMRSSPVSRIWAPTFEEMGAPVPVIAHIIKAA